MSKIIILGSGTCNLDPGRNAASVLLQIGGKNFIYDFGRGTAAQLARLGLKQDDISAVILSHYHPDHVSDLIPYLHAASWSRIDKRSKDLTIYGQPSIGDFMAKFFQPFGEQELSRGFQTNLNDLQLGDLLIDGTVFSFVDLQHSYGVSYGVSFVVNRKKYAVMADSDYHKGLMDALKNADIGIVDAGHITDEEIVKLAVGAQVKKLVCSHQYRKLDANKLNAQARERGFMGELVVAEDLMEFAI